MYYAVLSDIHGNMYALQKALEDLKQFDIESVLLLGDLIDYGMQSNEVVECIRDSFPYNVCCNIWGNHERAIMLNDFTRFSSLRGTECAKHTASLLREDVRAYLRDNMKHEGILEMTLHSKKCLMVHGSLEDPYWKSIMPDNVRGDYSAYDVVISGHSHYSHAFTKFYDSEDPKRRNKHAVWFINPGSVGQPRNHNPNAQYALLNAEDGTVILRAVPYEVKKTMALYDSSVDAFYQQRLLIGV